MNDTGSTHFLDKVHGVVPAAARLGDGSIAHKRKILEVLRKHYDFQSVADLGCGRAGWLRVAKSMGIQKVHGYDIPEIDISQREIKENEFTPVDLSEKYSFNQAFDLAISTEVAEHIPVNGTENFIGNLVEAAPVILFSAALPYQGGLGHVNENWVEYWHGFFQERDYHCIDFLRDKLWHDPSIPYYYRQNLLLYVNRDKLNHFVGQGMIESNNPKSLIHPDMYIKLVHRNPARVLDPRHSLQNDVNGYYANVLASGAENSNQHYGSGSYKPASKRNKISIFSLVRKLWSR
jgi:hypothetical protein